MLPRRFPHVRHRQQRNHPIGKAIPSFTHLMDCQGHLVQRAGPLPFHGEGVRPNRKNSIPVLAIDVRNVKAPVDDMTENLKYFGQTIGYLTNGYVFMWDSHTCLYIIACMPTQVL